MPDVLVEAESLVLEDSLQEQRAYLEEVFARSPDIQVTISLEDFSEQQRILDLVDVLDKSILALKRAFSSDSPESFLPSIKKAPLLWKKIVDVLDELFVYSDFLNPDFMKWINKIYLLSSTAFLHSKGYSLIFPFPKGEKIGSKKFNLQYSNYAQGMEFLSAYVDECMRYPEHAFLAKARTHIVPFVKYSLELIVDLEIGLKDLEKSNNSKNKDEIIRELRSLSWRIKNASKSIQYDLYRLNSFIVDFVEEEAVYVDPETAEGKAIQRIFVERDDSKDDIFDEEFDVDELLERIDQRVKKEAKA